MTRISISGTREELADVLNRVAYGGERIMIHRRGKNVAALVSVEDLKLIEALENKIDLREARKAMTEARKKGMIPWEKAKKNLGLK